MDCLISQDVMAASHSTCMLKFLLHLSSDKKIENKVNEHCKVRSLCSGALCVSFIKCYKNIDQILYWMTDSNLSVAYGLFAGQQLANS